MEIDRWQVLVGSIIAALLAYVALPVRQPLGTLLAGALAYLVMWLLVRFEPESGYGTAFSTPRAVLTSGVIVAIIGYSLFIAGQFLLGAITVVVVLLVSWTTSPRGPLAG